MCRLSVEDEWLESAHDRALSTDGDPMWLKWICGDVAEIETRWGQLGESGEYWMGRWMSGLDHKFGAPRW
jgi:hypothetical protein